uniref:Uncharacterized protein n=1 Tax=Globisporangium ultimum (strain ATCC 200006 / CBS 805.95 / DAOM BR144) TaxID=431595 RepID=K3WWU2_GLOUD
RFKEQPKSLKEEQGDVEYALPDVIPREPLAPKDDWVRIDRDMLVADKQNSLPVAAMERRESENELSNSDEDDAEEHHATTFGDKVALKDHHFQADVKDEDIDASQSLGDRELDCEQRHGQLSTDADSDNLGRNEETSANRSHQMALNLSANIRDEDDDEDFGMERKRYVESEEEDHDIDSDFDEGLDENADAALKNIEKPVDAEHPSDAELSQVKVKQPSEVDASDDTVEQSQEDESVGLGEHMGVNETNFHEETSDFEESGAMESSFAKQEIDAAHTSDVQLKDGDDPHRQLTVSHTANEVVRGVDEESSEPGRDDRDADSMPKLPEGGEIKENKIDSVAVHEVTRDHQAARDEEESVSSEEEERALNFQRDVLDENDLIDSEEDEDATSDTEQSFLQADAQGVHKTVDRTSLSRQSYHMEEDSEEDDMDEDDDMDEVERLLLEQSSMKQPARMFPLKQQHRGAVNDSDDEFGEASIDDEPKRQSHRLSILTSDRTDGHGVDSRDDASEGDTDNASDVELSPASKRRSSFDAASQSSSSASSPSASTRIPILNGSNLTDRVATDAIPSMLQLSPLYASEKVVDSEIRQQLSTLDNDDGDNDGDDDGEDEYLEESFDLEESLQDEDEE